MNKSFGPAVVDGEICFTSVSQLEKFDHESYGGCERRWAYRYVFGKPEPPIKAQRLGTQVHAQIEHFLKTGEDVLGELARAGQRFMPAPIAVDPGWLWVELELASVGEEGSIVSDLDCAGVPVVGFIDVLDARGRYRDDDGNLTVEPYVIEVLDWKTTARIDDELDLDTGIVTAKGYAKTAEQLANTHQMVGYAEYARRRFSHAKGIRVSHGYFQTRGPRAAVKRSTVISVDEVVKRWRRSENVVERMKSIARVTRAEDVPGNLSACNAYGKCPFLSFCPRDPKAVLAHMQKTSLTKEAIMGLLDKIRPARDPNAAPKVPNAEVKSEIAKLEAEERAAGAVITPPDMPKPEKIAEPLPEGSPEAAALAKIKAGTLRDQGNGHVSDKEGADTGYIIRPATPAETTALEKVPECESGKIVKLDTKAAVSKKYVCSCGEVQKVKPQEMPDGSYQALVPKHKISVTVEASAPTPDITEASTPKASTPKASTPKASTVSSPLSTVAHGDPGGAPGLSLYLDCCEDGVHAERLETYAEKLATDLAKAEGAADIRCAPEKSGLAFGRWKGALAVFAKQSPPAPGSYELSSTSELAMVVFEALAPTARRVVRG